MKMQSLNPQHDKLLQEYVSFIKGIVFEATAYSAQGKFNEFNHIINNVFRYTNSFRNIVKERGKIKEWAYMTPNLMLYSCMGFLAGIRNKQNNELIDELSSQLFEKTVDVVGESSEILDRLKKERLIKKRIAIIKKERNESNN